MFELKNFHAIKIGLASPETILSWSKGEVTKYETMNYRTNKPEPGGLFCEKIFGPVKDGECHCGHYRRTKYKGVVCPNCGVEVTESKVRRERMGHIQLATPVAHIWYYKGTTSKISIITDLSSKDIEGLLYFSKCLVVNPGENILVQKDPNKPAEKLSKYELIDPQTASIIMQDYENETNFSVLYGAEAVKHLLQQIDLKEEAKKIKLELDALSQKSNKTKEDITTTNAKYIKLRKRLILIESFIKSNTKPEWMILDVVPVLPPGMRPLIELDGGKRASSDLNELYKKVITTNNRLKLTIEKDAPEVMINSQKRELQEAVDALLNNEKKAKPITGGKTTKPLKSLTDFLTGKQGRFRQNLLGKRVDYSGRSVIVVGPELKMYECGLPKEMAKELFKPFVRAELMRRENIGRLEAKNRVEAGDAGVYNVLADVIKDHPVLLNRAPTLHRLGIQAFQPILVEGNAIKLHPLVCTAFNADFDGDQMAVHVPLSLEAQAEARYLMLSTNNILKLSDGSSVVSPTQDMLLGSYYMTLERPEGLKDSELKRYISKDEAIMAFELKKLKLQEPIIVRLQDTINGKVYKDTIRTTVGKIIFNSYIPQDLGFIDREKEENKLKLEINKPVDKKLLSEIILRCYKNKGASETAKMLDDIKEKGYKYSTLVALTANIYDMEIPKEKEEIIKDANEKVLYIESKYRQGIITVEGRKKEVIRIWEKAKDDCIAAVKANKNKYNDIWMMADSGARGNIGQIAQIVTMKGLVVSTSGTIELPIKSSFREGLSVLEYFIASHTSRKTLSDTALKTADSGYLTRKLVDVAHDVIIKEHKCHDTKGQIVRKIVDKSATDPIISLADRIKGRYTIDEIIDPKTGRVIVEKDSMISNEQALEIEAAGIEEVKIRTVFSCTAKHAPCARCYGRSMAGSEIVNIGDAVGVIAAQSIGEPGTQLTMRTFHSGGVASSKQDDITQGLPRVNELFDKRKPKIKAILALTDGIVSYNKDSLDQNVYITDKNGEKTKYDPKDLQVIVRDGEEVKKGDALTIGSKNLDELLVLQTARGVQDYIMTEVLKIYKVAGVPVNPKHIEIIISQMLKRCVVIESGDSTELIKGETIEISKLKEEMEKVISQDDSKQPPAGKPIIQGITKSALASESFLSAASFQETSKVLTEAAIKGKIDYLVGLKENVILGKLIPAGTGLDEYQDIEIKSNATFNKTESVDDILSTQYDDAEIEDDDIDDFEIDSDIFDEE